ncbi:MAG: hypothetical protein JSV18_03305 [Candidatus Bathyarchaeota archaeon]|nr:MAG: hypothetical protein JSV18_03305 [Candidatus Bathyarchaeota archaeon]
MNEYTRGAFECLSWLEELITRLKKRGDHWESLKREIDGAILDIRRGIGVDFRERLRATA